MKSSFHKENEESQPTPKSFSHKAREDSNQIDT